VLKHYFPRVTTLREHLSKDLQDRGHNAKAIDRIVQEHNTPIAQILDTVIVGYRNNTEKSALRERRAKDVLSFTQQLPSSTIGGHGDVAHGAQLEVVDFVIWLLFRRDQPPSRPQHLLSQGFDRLAAKGQRGLNLSAAAGIPGIICRYSNPHIELVTSTAWCALLSLLEQGGDIVMVDLLLECCLFLPVSSNSRSLQQFSGIYVPSVCAIFLLF
jgi:telomerase reverse transcriptase